MTLRLFVRSLFFILVFTSQSLHAQGTFAGGSGTEGDPYLVATAEHLDQVRNHLGAHFRQTADISLSGYATGSGWAPIGTYESTNPSLGFTGSYDGQNHTISDLTISGSGNTAGLFGALSPNAVVQNLRLKDVSISGSGSLRGAVAGRSLSATIQQVSVSGAITGASIVGGLVGYMDGGWIFTSYSDATVNGSTAVGGVVGRLRHSVSATIQEVYSVANVTASGNFVGGIVGVVDSDNASLNLARIVSDATVSGGGYAGMIAGVGLAPARNATRTNVFFSLESGLPGHGDWDNPIFSIDQRVDLPGGRTRNQLRDVATYTGFDFDTIWDIKNTGEASFPFLRGIPQIPVPGYLTTPEAPLAQLPLWATTVTQPELRWSRTAPADSYELQVAQDSLFTGSLVISTTVSGTTHTLGSPLAVGTYYWRVRGVNTARNETGAWSTPKALAIAAFASGSGTTQDPYRVATAAELFVMREFRTAHFRQTADIDLEPSGHWIPIATPAAPFTGSYDGQRFSISGLTQSGRLSNVGLFGVLSSATVANVKLTTVQISVAFDSVGAIAGLATANSLVQGASVDGAVTGRVEVGGLIGRLISSNLTTSYSLATVTGVARVGGLVGALQESALQDSYSLASVTVSGERPILPDGGVPSPTAGGLVGNLSNASVARVYADATVTGSNTEVVGQIAGSGFTCTASGAIVYNADRGQRGLGFPGIPLTASYCQAEGFSRSPLLMRSPDTYFGWDFSTTWQIDQVGASSFPYLRAAVQSPSPGVAEAFFAGGTGTPGDPYQVATAEHLSNVRYFPSGHFIQTADISLAHIPNWQPIDATNGFDGMYNGQHYRIVGLTIIGNVSNAGLFARTSGLSDSVFENVRLTEVDIQSTGDYVGGLVGEVQGGATIRNVSVSGSIFGRENVGGVAGSIYSYPGLSAVYSDATVVGENRVGGLIGYITFGSAITDSYSLANVTATRPEVGQAAGMVGSFMTYADITRVYVDATVQGAYTDPVAMGEYSDFGSPPYTPVQVYVRQDDPMGGVDPSLARTSTQLRQQATFSGWDFTSVWAIDSQPTPSYPYLRAIPQRPRPGQVAPILPATWDTNPGTSFSADGTTILRFPYEAELNPAAFTVEAWVRPTSIGSQARTVVSSRNGGAGYEMGINADGIWSAWSGTVAGGTTLTGGAAAADTWTHLALVHTGTVARFYVNGRLASEQNTTLQANAASDLVIGGTFIGQLDEVRIWSDAASAQTLRLRMHEAPVAAESTLRLHLPFDEADGSVVFDRSGDERWTVAEGTAAYSAQIHPAGSFINGTQDAWYFLANPTAGITLAQFLEPLWTQGAAGSDAPGAPGPNVFTLNETLGTYQAVTNLNVPAVPGKGYLVRVYKNDVYQVEGSFPKRLSLPRAEAPVTVELPVTYTPSHAFAGFSLVGNPYPYSLDLGSEAWEFSSVAPTVYVYDQAINNYRTWNRSTGSASNNGSAMIAPNQGFLMMASAASPVARVPRTARASQASMLLRSAESEPDHVRLDITLVRGDRREQMQVLLMDESHIAPVRDMTRQLEPLQSERFMIYAVEPTTGLKIETFEHDKLAKDILELPVHAEITSDGENRLRFDITGELNPEWAVMLLDTRTGTRTDLRVTPEVVFQGISSAMKAAPNDTLLGMVSQTMSAESARFRLLIGPASQLPSDEELPTDVALEQNYPNPFNPSTVIGFTLDADRHTSLKVYDVLGREVAVLIDGPMSAGRHKVSLDASSLAGGVYVYRLQVDGMVLSRKMTLVK